MKNDDLHTLLAELAEEALPTSRLDLWPALKERLTSRQWPSPQGETSMKQPIARTSLFRYALLALLALGIASLFLMASPLGQALSQGLSRFFTVAESTSFPVPSEQVLPPPPTSTPAPTYLLPLETARPPLPSATADPSCLTPASQAGYFCQIQAAESQAGFNAKEPPFDPKGMKFSTARFDPAGHSVEMQFVVTTGGGYLNLRQGMGDPQQAGGWDEAPAEAIEETTVNGQYAEFVSGTFVVSPNSTSAVWQAGGGLRLRWQEGERWFHLEKLGDPYPIEWMGKDELIELAESLVDARPAGSALPLDPEYLPSVEAAEALAGFEVLSPGLLPAGYELKRVVWADGVVRLLYGPQNSSDTSLMISMGPVTDHTVGPCADCPPGAEESVQIGPWQGWYLRGAFAADSPSSAGPTPTPVWEAEARSWEVSWNTASVWVAIWFHSSAYGGEEMNRETLLEIARNMK